jgi:site-specific DNA recombinase
MSREKKQSSPLVRCAIYTRVSTAEQAEGDYSSLDSQRETGEAYVAAQKHAGWQCLPGHYDDGGFTGANTDRPAFQRLLSEIKAGRVDCVVCYKLDRLTRSLLDFARTLEILEKHNVALVSVTQAFDTSTATGKLMMHILMSFAEFERQLISERTRDKVAAARRRGKWSGGMPILGYDVIDAKLLVDELEADRVRQIFDLYLARLSLTATAKELNGRGWATKRWTTKKGTHRGGRAFTKNSLYQLLTNVTYIGQIKYKDEIHDGQHRAIVDPDVFRRTQLALRRNGRDGGRTVRNKHGALLRGLLRCKACDCAMVHGFTTKGNRRYRYYICAKAQRCGWHACPTPSLPSGEIERFVVEQIRCIGQDAALVAATLAETRRQSKEAIGRLTREKNSQGRQRRADEAELRRLAATPATDGHLARLAEVQQRIVATTRRLSELDAELAQLADSQIEDAEVTAALADFDAVWQALTPREQARILALLIERIDHDGQRGNVSITFRPTGIKALAAELAKHEEHAA